MTTGFSSYLINAWFGFNHVPTIVGDVLLTVLVFQFSLKDQIILHIYCSGRNFNVISLSTNRCIFFCFMVGTLGHVSCLSALTLSYEACC